MFAGRAGNARGHPFTLLEFVGTARFATGLACLVLKLPCWTPVARAAARRRAIFDFRRGLARVGAYVAGRIAQTHRPVIVVQAAMFAKDALGKVDGASRFQTVLCR